MHNSDISKVNVFSHFSGSQYSLAHNSLTGVFGSLISKWKPKSKLFSEMNFCWVNDHSEIIQ